MVRYLAIGKETVAFGTPAAAVRYEAGVGDVKPDQNWIIPEPVVQREMRKKSLGIYRARGTIGENFAEPEGILGDLLLGAFGSESVTTPITGVKRHLFTGAETLPSYTLRLGVEQTQRIIAGMLVESLTLKYKYNDAVKYTAEVLSGVVETKAAIDTPTLSALKSFAPTEGTNVCTIATADKKALVYEAELTIKNNIPFDRGSLAGRGFDTKRYGKREVSGKLSMYFDDSTEYDRFIAGTEFDLNLKIQNGEIVVEPQPYYLELDVRKCVYEKGVAPPVKPQNEPLVVDAPFKAFYDTTAGFNSECKVTLQNSIAAY